MRHPDEQIAALVADDLVEDERVAVEQHLVGCARCVALREQLSRASRALLIPEPTLTVPALAHAQRQGVMAPALPAFALIGALLLGVAIGAVARDYGVGSPAAPSLTAASPSSSPSAARTSSPGPSASGVSPTALAPSPNPSPSASIAASTCSTQRDGASGAMLQACAGSGPVGTRVILEGRGCSSGGAEVTVVFGTRYDDTGQPESAVGWVQLPPITAASDGSFRSEVVIPAQLGSRQGAGGGPTTPGRYQFFSKPAVCAVPFTVTAR